MEDLMVIVDKIVGLSSEIQHNFDIIDHKNDITTLISSLYPGINKVNVASVLRTAVNCAIRNHRCYGIYTELLINALVEYISINMVDKSILEVGAGNGLLGTELISAGVNIISITDKNPVNNLVIKMDALDAVRYFNPDVVLCSWPSQSNLYPENIMKQEIPCIVLGNKKTAMRPATWNHNDWTELPFSNLVFCVEDLIENNKNIAALFTGE